jgi:hypothetical protein
LNAESLRPTRGYYFATFQAFKGLLKQAL